jgi:uncharacterized protein YndB with AHSA1/START domain
MPDSVTVSTQIDAPPEDVWAALTRPELVARWMMGAAVETDWQVGHPITWSGSLNGRNYRDKGTVEAFEPPRRLSVTHWSPLSSLADEPANYHTVTYELAPRNGGTHLSLTQQNLTGVSEEQSRRNWQPMLDSLKHTVEAA